MRVVELLPGYAEALMEVTPHHLNLFRMVPGGVIFSIADHACEAVESSFGEPAGAIQNTIHFLSMGRKGNRLEATGRVVHRTRWIGFIEATAPNQRQELLAQCHQVIYSKGRKS